MKFHGDSASDTSSCFPKGDYYVQCTAVEDKDKDDLPLKSKSGNDMWILELTVSEGEYQGRKLWHYLPFIAAGQPGHGLALKCLKAFGIDPEGDIEILPEHLLNIVAKASVDVEQSDPRYDPKNVVKRWHSADELRKLGSAPTAAPKKTPVAASTVKKPLWSKKPTQGPAPAEDFAEVPF